MSIKFIVEGKADKKFIRDLLIFKFSYSTNDDDFVLTDGWTGLEMSKPSLQVNTESGGINLVIFDADEDFESRRDQILRQMDSLELDFNLFLMPNNNETGTLETLLLKIVNPEHQGLLDCFEAYQDCIGGDDLYDVPTEKSKVYAYYDALLPHGRQKRFLGVEKRDYLNNEHWNLDSDELNPLVEYLESHLV